MYFPVSCGVPPSPSNGFVDFTNVIEGSEATFRCDSGPEMTAVCTASGEWVPNPGDLSCSQPPGQGNQSPSHAVPFFCHVMAACGAPPSLSSGFVDFTSVIEGSEATFRCDLGPVMTAVCTASGEWVPNPGD